MALPLGTYLLVFGALLAFLSTYPYVATALEFRQRDNGLAYILLVLGVGVWNGLFVAQLLGEDPLVKSFFLSLHIVGGLLAGLGWFLFAGTASSTPEIPQQRAVFGAVATLIGLDVALAITAPVHTFYWVFAPGPTDTMFAVVEPGPGYWLHTALLASLFGAGALLFALAWRAGTPDWEVRDASRYVQAYTVLGTAMAAAVVAGNVFYPGGFSIAPPLAVGLTTTGWVQAQGGEVTRLFRSLASRV